MSLGEGPRVALHRWSAGLVLFCGALCPLRLPWPEPGMGSPSCSVRLSPRRWQTARRGPLESLHPGRSALKNALSGRRWPQPVDMDCTHVCGSGPAGRVHHLCGAVRGCLKDPAIFAGGRPESQPRDLRYPITKRRGGRTHLQVPLSTTCCCTIQASWQISPRPRPRCGAPSNWLKTVQYLFIHPCMDRGDWNTWVVSAQRWLVVRSRVSKKSSQLTGYRATGSGDDRGRLQRPLIQD
jgi:hypothetical protein